MASYLVSGIYIGMIPVFGLNMQCLPLEQATLFTRPHHKWTYDLKKDDVKPCFPVSLFPCFPAF
jgi:hypothetical protein